MSKELAANSTISHYRIVSKIGAGGMGEVYLARDTKLDRKVALKILPPDLASNRERMQRFVREAKSAAALNHPNIATVYEIGGSEGIHFIAMEFIDGVTLREKIHREQTELSKLLRCLQHAAEGLAKAHAAGVVHRDLKPDNIMITRDGHAKILDFGLAKLIEQPPVSESGSSQVATAVMVQHSIPGAVMGTVGYMSPEQAQGKTTAIDQRSDVFSFGCILFETATGKKPFEGDSAVKSLHMTIYEQPPSIAELNPAAPTELQRIIRRCLAKDPDERYQSIKEVAIELKALRRELADHVGDTSAPPARSESSGPADAISDDSAVTQTGAPSSSLSTQASSVEYVVTGIKRHKLAVALAILVLIAGGVSLGLFWHARNSEVAIDSIAVLPFENRSSAADSDYLSDGLAESLIYRLSQLPNLKVSPTSSVMRYKGKETDVKKVASELGVNAVMTGHIAQRGDDLTISVELVDARYNKVIWGEQYDRKMSDLMATQREIAMAIVQKLELKLASTETTRITKKYTNSNDAYQQYLKARYHFLKRTKTEMLEAAEQYKQAIALDPNFALAYARLAETYIVLPSYPYMTPAEALPQARSALQRALAIDPDLSEAHTFMGCYLANYEFKWLEAEREFKRALELDPNSSAAHFRYAQLLLQTGRLDESIAEMKKSLDLEPLDVSIGCWYSRALLFAGRKDAGVEAAKKVYELDPNHRQPQHFLAMAYTANGMYDQAIALIEPIVILDPTNQSVLATAGRAYALAGKREKAQEMLRKLEELQKTEYVVGYRMAGLQSALGERDKAFALLEKSFQDQEWEIGFMKFDVIITELHSDPRFDALVKRLNLP